MSAVTPPTAWDQHTPTTLPPSRPRSQQSRAWRRALHPLTAICAVQAALSLTLVWSNTAFEDEAQFLWVGRLLIAHWLHGTSWPSAFAAGNFSGSPLIYPPLGALANSVAGLAGARILSLIFMLGATILLYLTASRLFGRTAANFSTSLWAISEPTIRLAFATYDPLSVLLTALSVWLIVLTDCRRSRPALVAAAAIVLTLANVTAYSGIVIDPIVLVFAFLLWLPYMGARQALLRTAYLAGASALFFGLLMTVWRSWGGIAFAVLSRSSFAQQSLLVVIDQIWEYSGLIIALAIVGVVAGMNTLSRPRGAMVALLGCATLVVPVAQLHAQTAESLDKHLAYGIWFGVIAAGYGCKTVLRQLPRAGKRLVVVCCVIALVYPAATSWQQASARFHGWANAQQFVASLAPFAARSHGLIYVPWHEAYIAQYYMPLGYDWKRWNSGLSLDPAAKPAKQESYYTTQLKTDNYAAIVLFYSTTFASAPALPRQLLLPQGGSGTNQQLLLVGEDPGEPGLPALTLALEQDPHYYRAAVGQYDSASQNGIYAIWEKRVQT
jgi:Dolichyl-phosphate-mannose-protein mannosyltransferase